jgi:hypothetical protein
MAPRQPVQESISPIAPSPAWVVGRTDFEDGQIIELGRRPYSYSANCECPDDCLRDHDNE